MLRNQALIWLSSVLVIIIFYLLVFIKKYTPGAIVYFVLFRIKRIKRDKQIRENFDSQNLHPTRNKLSHLCKVSLHFRYIFSKNSWKSINKHVAWLSDYVSQFYLECKSTGDRIDNIYCRCIGASKMIFWSSQLKKSLLSTYCFSAKSLLILFLLTIMDWVSKRGNKL